MNFKTKEEYFKDYKNITHHELLAFFMTEFPDLVQELKDTLHAKSPGEVNPYHVEDCTFTHTLLVLKYAGDNKFSKIVLIVLCYMI